VWTEAARRIKNITRHGFRSIPPQDREDIEQRILVKLLDEPTLRAAAGATAPGIYIAHMIRNEAFDFVRRKLRDEQLATELCHDHNAAPSSTTAWSNELHDRLDIEFTTLTTVERTLLLSKFADGMGIAEIAAEMVLPYSTVAKRLVRAIAKLRTRLQQADA